jgi:hypothetical protein
VKVVGAITVAFFLTAGVASAGAARWTTFHASGVSISYPPGWHATARPLTNVTSPVQVLAVASFRFPKSPRPNGCEPAATLAAMQPRGALIYVIEYGSGSAKDFPPRPARLKLTRFGRAECFGPSYAILFRQAGRYFQVQVAFGRTATRATRTTALRIVDTFVARRRA